MKFCRLNFQTRLCSLGMLFALLSIVAYPGAPTVHAQSNSCNFTTASLNPRGVFQGPINSYAQNILNLRLSAVSINPTVNSANLLQNAQVNFNALNGRAFGTFFNLNLGQNFPPTNTATLPRPAFNPLGTLAFYTFAGPLNAFQLQGVQALYAADQISRRNYGVNLANLARNFTSLQQAGANQNATNFALNALRNAYNTLSNPAAPAPDPRNLYRTISIAYVATLRSAQGATANLNPTQAQLESDLAALSTSDIANTATIGGVSVQVGLNMLGIGLANYDTNRLPVPNGNNAATPTQAPAGTFPFANFDAARTTPLSQAQATPAGLLGPQVVAQLQRFGLNRDQNSIIYQVNSADALQFVFVPMGNNNDTLTMFYARGFPATPNQLPEFSYTARSASQFLLGPNGSINDIGRRSNLASYYNNPANLGRRNNYIANLNNINCALQRIQQSGGLNASSSQAIQNALNTVRGALQQLTVVGPPDTFPDVFQVYQTISASLNTLSQQNLTGANQAQDLATLQGSLMPIGLINYYLVPITLGGI